jgi:hypothetical protein
VAVAVDPRRAALQRSHRVVLAILAAFALSIAVSVEGALRTRFFVYTAAIPAALVAVGLAALRLTRKRRVLPPSERP